jgi:hypothetical protein
MYRLLQIEKHKRPRLVALRCNGFSIALLICSTQHMPEFLWTLPFRSGSVSRVIVDSRVLRKFVVDRFKNVLANRHG